ncbi:MAG: haloacid dehalogenase type II [Pseudomonadota bacterium]
MPITTCIFDAYGTLFDVSAAAREAASQPGAESWAEHWPQIAALWRQKQLEYTWLRATAGQHRDFWLVTQDGLDFALESVRISDDGVRQKLLDLYFTLSAYPEVPTMLSALKEAGLRTGILSNGSPEMLNGAVESADIGPSLDAVLSVEAVGVFKPHPSVYDLVGAHFGTAREEVLFVSSNGWDAAAASGYGFQTVWVNRLALPQDRLWAAPAQSLSDLTTIPDLARRL